MSTNRDCFVVYSLDSGITRLLVSLHVCTSWFVAPTFCSAAYNLALNGNWASYAATGDFHFVNDTVLYVAQDSQVNGTGGIRRYDNPSGSLTGNWNPVNFGDGSQLRNAPNGLIGVKGLTGRWEGSRHLLYLTTSVNTAGGNSLWKYDTSFDSNPVPSNGWTLLASTPSSANAFAGLFFAPVVPSQTPTRSSSEY